VGLKLGWNHVVREVETFIPTYSYLKIHFCLPVYWYIDLSNVTSLNQCTRNFAYSAETQNLQPSSDTSKKLAFRRP
jgi:hypothetical protein